MYIFIKIKKNNSREIEGFVETRLCKLCVKCGGVKLDFYPSAGGWKKKNILRV